MTLIGSASSVVLYTSHFFVETYNGGLKQVLIPTVLFCILRNLLALKDFINYVLVVHNKNCLS